MPNNVSRSTLRARADEIQRTIDLLKEKPLGHRAEVLRLAKKRRKLLELARQPREQKLYINVIPGRKPTSPRYWQVGWQQNGKRQTAYVGKVDEITREEAQEIGMKLMEKALKTK